MPAVRRGLLQAQADQLRLPLHVVELPWPCADDVYEERMTAACRPSMVFGDLFLDDPCPHRENALAGTATPKRRPPLPRAS